MTPACDGDGHVLPGVIDDAIEFLQREDEIGGAWLVSPGLFSGAAASDDMGIMLVGPSENGAHLFFGFWCGDADRHEASIALASVGGRIGASDSSSFQRNSTGADEVDIKRSPRCPRFPADGRVRARASRRTGAGAGTLSSGLESCSGSKAQRTSCMVSRSGSANIFAMHVLSSPRPRRARR